MMFTPAPLNNTDGTSGVKDANLLKKLTRAFGLLAILTCLIGIIGNISGNILFSSVCQGCKTIALSAALIWIFFGAVLVYTSFRPFKRISRILLQAILVIIVCMEILEIISVLRGEQFIIETWSVTAGSLPFGSLSSPISPVAAVFIIITATGLFFCIDPTVLSSPRYHEREISVIAGIIIALAGFTLALSYLFGTPLVLGKSVIPIAALSALAAVFIGLGLIAAVGSAAFPVCFFMGDSIRARLLRTFVTLTVAITFCETILFSVISAWFKVSNEVMISASLVIFIIVTSIIVGRVSEIIGQALDRKEQELADKNTDLVATAMAQKRIEDTLRSTSQYLENLINHANAPIIVWDADYRILRFNHAFEFLTGMAADRIIGEPLDILFPEKSRHDSMELIRRTSGGERWDSVEIPVIHISGAIKIVLWNSANIYDAEGVTIVSTIAQGQDITERKDAEESAKKTASLLHAALDSTADGILVVDNSRIITSYNTKFCAIWDIPEHTLDAADEATALAYMTPLVTDAREFTDRRNDLYNHPGRESFDTVTLKDGRIFERHSLPQKVGDTIVGRVWSYRDVTERRQAEISLQESLEKFRAIAISTPDHIAVQDKKLRYVQVINPQLGLTEKDMIGKTEYDFLRQEDADTLTTIKRHVLESGEAVHDEISLTNSRGEKNYFAGSYVPRRNEAGEIDGIIGYFQNVTETKKANEKILAALAEKEILIREIHHRVKNNLQIITGLLDMTRTRSQDPETSGILTDMMLKIKTMAQIHTRLYESHQSGQVNMGGQIQNMVTDLSGIFAKSCPVISCEVDVVEFSLPVDLAIPCALVINEVLSNAFKHAFSGRTQGTIRVLARQEGEQIHISIQDDGTGIPENVDPDRTSSLGLKLIRNLVQQVRGTLAIESTSQGTQVTIHFPLETGG
jgi:PAS domain S-box-containing protein